MADIDTNNGIMEVKSRDDYNENGEAESVSEIAGNINGEVGVNASEEDILQHALVDETDAFPDTSVQIQYTEGVQALQEEGIITTGDDGVQFMTTETENEVQLTDGPVQLSTSFENGNFILSSDPNNQTNAVVDGSLSTTDAVVTATTPLVYVSSTQQQQTVVTNNIIKPQNVSAQNSNPPLGSSLNPIRIIQQGNQYTPVQQLSNDQLQQIMQVVQQQQVSKTLDSGSSVLFNPQTNTRIVYRVIYPSDLHKDVVDTKNDPQILSFVTPKKTYKKRHREDDAEKADGPELSKEEKDQRKKIRPKTRSGRVSKPPKHMVKDFKHIHVLDYDEDYDDSDGGYSDYKVDECDDEIREPRKAEDSMLGLSHVKPKNWKCESCGKAYIGRAGLCRHLKLYPSHGTLDPDGDGDMVPPEHPPADLVKIPVNGNVDEECSISGPGEDMPSEQITEPVTPTTPNGNSTASFSEDSRDSVANLIATPVVTPRPQIQTRGHNRRGRPRGHRGHWRGRGSYTKLDQETRRKNKLKDITRESTDEELMEIVLPRLAKVITLWEFLLMKVERGDPAWPHADDIYMEYAKLHQHVKKLCQEYLQYVSDAEPDKDESLFQVESNRVSESLGLKCGAHKVKEIPDSDVDIYKYKFLTTNHNVDIDYNNKSILKRTVAVVPQEQIVTQAKKPRQPKQLQSVPYQIPSHVNITRSQPVMTSANVLMNSFPQPSGVLQGTDNVQILSSPGSVNQNHLSISGKSQGSSQRAVSLLSNSIIKSPASSSLQTTKSASPKFIIVSGMPQSGSCEPQIVGVAAPDANTGVRTFLPIASNSTPMQTVAGGQTVVALTNNPSLTADQLIVSSDTLDTPSTASLNPKPVEPSIVQPTSILPYATVTSQQSMYITIPQSSQNQTPVLQPSLLDQSSVNSSEQVVANNGQFIMKYASSEDVNVLDSGDKVSAGGQSYMLVNSAGDGRSSSDVNTVKDQSNTVFTIQCSETSDMNTINNSVTGSTNNVERMDTGESFSVDSAMLLVNDPTKTELINNNGAPAQDLQKDMMSSSSASGVNVVNTLDTSETTQIQDSLQQCSKVAFQGTTAMGDGVTDAITEMVASTTGSEEASQREDESDKQIVHLETDGTGGSDLLETLQIPATNIYQTEDGLVIIQNPDGATFQLQGSDGQPISLETVQALMGMDGETQIITQPTEQFLEQE